MRHRTVSIARAGALRALALAAILPAIVCAGCTPAWYTPPADDEPILSDYDYLAQYGVWVDVPRYGPVWRPFVVEGWSPFHHGNWAWTNDGWAWVSYEPFGELVYHYGYWDYSLRYGWVWIPDDVWSPARVVWYTFDGYTAWAPMPPPGMGWHDPWDPWDVPVWVIVPYDRFADEDIGTVRIRGIVDRSVIKPATARKRPPSIGEVRRRTKEPIREITIERERLPVEREVIQTRKKTVRRTTRPLKKMVLPEREREKVDDHSEKVKREVLTPKKTRTVPERKTAPAEKKREPT
ncbi:MAG TPA: hypothetical protein ENO23_04890, partial [Alphaproteobacteria bacterium]|nr:hypothetical protein [Alphaproteobacteria bacterium]